METVDMDIWFFSFFVNILNFEILGPISAQNVIYGPYGPYILVKSICLWWEGVYSPDEQGGGSPGKNGKNSLYFFRCLERSWDVVHNAAIRSEAKR